MDWKQIPSLAALRAFEATIRCGSFAGAARELNVTDAAIRQHVRALEAHFDAVLAERKGRNVSPTQVGVELAVGLTDGFERIQNVVERLQRAYPDRPVRLALTPAFAETWLIPRLPGFWAKHPEIQIDLAPSLKTVDLALGEHDLAIRYGRGNWPDSEKRFLVSAEYTVVASPTLGNLGPVASADELKDAVWLFEEGREEHRKWATEHGLCFDAKKNRFYPNNSLVLSAVRAGHGYSLQSRALIESDVSTGALVEVYCEQDECLGYYVLSYGTLRRDSRIFTDWLLGAATNG